MQETRLIMGMPITIEIIDPAADENALAAVFDYFTCIDETFSTYKPESEIMRINRGELAEKDWSDDMRVIFMLAEETKRRTGGFFDIQKPDASGNNSRHSGRPPQGEPPQYDPSGIVKGWAIWNAAKILEGRGFKNFYIDAGGDIQTRGGNASGVKWSVGIRNPFEKSAKPVDEIIKTIYAAGEGIATSGTYIRGEHIYNPKTGGPANEMVSLTVIGPNIYEADRFATAAFAMGAAGIRFVESLRGFEGYMIDKGGIATMTTGFDAYTH